MTLPSTNFSMRDISTEAGGVSLTDLYASDLFKKSYFEGPNGSYNISYNAWGQYGNTIGANVIYNVASKDTNNSFNDFSLKTYFYDNSTYLVGLQIDNTLPTPAGGYNNDFTVYVELWDSSYTYTYVSTGAITVTQGTVYGPTIISTTSTPIISNGYWRITFVSDNLDPAIPQLVGKKEINGTPVDDPLTNSPYSTDTFTGTQSVAYYSGIYTATGLQFNIIIST